MMTMVVEDDGFCWRLPKMAENSSWRRESVSSTSLLFEFVDAQLLLDFWTALLTQLPSKDV